MLSQCMIIPHWRVISIEMNMPASAPAPAQAQENFLAQSASRTLHIISVYRFEYQTKTIAFYRNHLKLLWTVVAVFRVDWFAFRCIHNMHRAAINGSLKLSIQLQFNIISVNCFEINNVGNELISWENMSEKEREKDVHMHMSESVPYGIIYRLTFQRWKWNIMNLN